MQCVCLSTGTRNLAPHFFPAGIGSQAATFQLRCAGNYCAPEHTGFMPNLLQMYARSAPAGMFLVRTPSPTPPPPLLVKCTDYGAAKK